MTGLRFPVVVDGGARIGRGEQLRLVKFTAHAPACIQLVKLAGAWSGSLPSLARKLLRLRLGRIVIHKKTVPNDFRARC